jgi:hypothetical protein
LSPVGLPSSGAPRSKKIEALLDSGASRTTFHSSIGKALGFNIEEGEIEEPLGFGGKSGATYVHEIALYAPGGVLTTRAAFSELIPIAAVLGMAGFFEHFKITFDHSAKSCDLQRI